MEDSTNKDNSIESPSDRANRIISKRPKNKQSLDSLKLSTYPSLMTSMNYGSGNPIFSSTFKHLNAKEQILNLTIDTELLASGAVTTDKLDIDSDLSFNQNQAIQLRLENVTSIPVAGNPGRLVWDTTTEEVLVDTGSIFESVSAIGTVSDVFSDSNPPLTGSIQFVSGINVTLSQFGNSITINASAGAIVYQQDLFDVTVPSNHTLVLTFTPILSSETLSWNGLVLRPGVSNDYTILGNVITLNAGMQLTVGDGFLATYSH